MHSDYGFLLSISMQMLEYGLETGNNILPVNDDVIHGNVSISLNVIKLRQLE
jgi:hypothetical protein